MKKLKKKLKDYGLRIIYHGAWSDPEIEWKKSKFQTLLFNYWDCVACFDNDYNFDPSKEEDIVTLEDWLWNLTPSEYCLPEISYSWQVYAPSKTDFDFDYESLLYDDCDYYKEYKLSAKKDFVLHNASQALRQALSYICDRDIRNCEISVYLDDRSGRKLVANYKLQGSTLKDDMSYKK